ncbi:MAG: tetratricopeptide repeat protein [Arcobacteraceae bacterium]|nr:tetratricopeptide repeat protein [Arcobacteraceae bacterium]
MKIVFSLLFLGTLLFGDIFDDYHLYKANGYISLNKYQKALEHYEKVENKTATIYYNLGNLYYMQGEYQKAITSYKKVDEATLEFQTLHNLGNSYVKIDQIDKAMMSYQKAILLKSDPATKTNLALLLASQKKELETKKRTAKGKQSSKEKNSLNRGFKGQEDLDDGENRDNGEVSKQGKSVQKKNPKDPKENVRTTTSALQGEQQIEPIGSNKGATTSSKQRKRLEILAHNEEKKWATIIEKRKLNTLLIPLNQKGVVDENIDNPW